MICSTFKNTNTQIYKAIFKTTWKVTEKFHFKDYKFLLENLSRLYNIVKSCGPLTKCDNLIGLPKSDHI